MAEYELTIKTAYSESSYIQNRSTSPVYVFDTSNNNVSKLNQSERIIIPSPGKCYIFSEKNDISSIRAFVISDISDEHVGFSYCTRRKVYSTTGNTTASFTFNDTDPEYYIPVSGVSSLSVTADSGINSILYNSMTYDTFPATIPLDPAATTMQVESKSPVVTINDGGNLKSVTYGSATYTKFPATVTATTPEFALIARGKDSPVITVRTERTQTPVITNT